MNFHPEKLSICIALFVAGISPNLMAQTKPSTAECRKQVAEFLLQQPRPTHQKTYERIWSGVESNDLNRESIALTLAGGIDLDVSRMKMAWRIDGFSDAVQSDKDALASLIIDGYLEGAIGDNSVVQQLKDGFRILPTELEVHPPVPPPPHEPFVPRYDPFIPPSGLTMPPDMLLSKLGFNHQRQLDNVAFPYTPEMCVRLATECYRRCLYADAKAIAAHGRLKENLPELVYLQGNAELALGDQHATLTSVRTLVSLQPRVRAQDLANISGPICVRFLIAYRYVEREPTINAAELFSPNAATRR